MSGLNISSLCVDHDEASAMYASLTLAISALCFYAETNTVYLAGWAGALRGGLTCQSGFVQEPCAAKPVGRPGDSRRGPRARNALSVARH